MPKKENKKKTSDELKNESDKDIIEFLKYGIGYLENRISIVDKKASVLIAVLTLLFGFFIFIIKEIFFTNPHIKIGSYIVLTIIFIIFLLTLSLLLQTIRPSNWFFGKEILFNRKLKDDDKYIMWFTDCFPIQQGDYCSEPAAYLNKVNNFNLTNIKENYKNTHFITLQLIRRKYKFYPYAIICMKVLVLSIAIGLLALVLILHFG